MQLHHERALAEILDYFNTVDMAGYQPVPGARRLAGEELKGGRLINLPRANPATAEAYAELKRRRGRRLDRNGGRRLDRGVGASSPTFGSYF